MLDKTITENNTKNRKRKELPENTLQKISPVKTGTNNSLLGFPINQKPRKIPQKISHISLPSLIQFQKSGAQMQGASD